MDIVAKITLVASVIMLGYNLYQLFTSYEAVCTKVEEVKQMAKESESDEGSVKRSNFLLTGALCCIFVILVILSDLAYWVVGVVVVKMLVTLVMSHKEVDSIFKSDSVDRKFFRWVKADAAANVLTGLAIAIVVIS